jgi:hypothetical protein
MRAKLINVTFHCPRRIQSNKLKRRLSGYNIIRSCKSVRIGKGPGGNTRLIVSCPCGEDHELRLRWDTEEIE